jgi:hypothetical protein
MRRAWGSNPYGMNIDRIEYRMIDGYASPRAVLETTHYRYSAEGCYQGVLDRFESTANGHCLRLIAARLNVRAWIILHDEPCTDFHIWNLTDGAGWFRKSRDPFNRWLDSL